MCALEPEWRCCCRVPLLRDVQGAGVASRGHAHFGAWVLEGAATNILLLFGVYAGIYNFPYIHQTLKQCVYCQFFTLLDER